MKIKLGEFSEKAADIFEAENEIRIESTNFREYLNQLLLENAEGKS